MPGFDPYYKWLGIPPEEHPPTLYRVLGVKDFESDPEVIEAAAEQRMIFLQRCATGAHVKESQALLNEVAAARVVLLCPRRKAAYNEHLTQLRSRPAVGSASVPNNHDTSTGTVAAPTADVGSVCSRTTPNESAEPARVGAETMDRLTLSQPALLEPRHSAARGWVFVGGCVLLGLLVFCVPMFFVLMAQMGDGAEMRFMFPWTEKTKIAKGKQSHKQRPTTSRTAAQSLSAANSERSDDPPLQMGISSREHDPDQTPTSSVQANADRVAHPTGTNQWQSARKIFPSDNSSATDRRPADRANSQFTQVRPQPANETDTRQTTRTSEEPALQATQLNIVGGPFKPGDTVTLSHLLEVVSDSTFVARRDHVFTCWVEREGHDRIPGISRVSFRRGSTYRVGGFTVSARRRLPAGFARKKTHKISTTGWPPGSYTVRIECATGGDATMGKPVRFTLAAGR